MNFKLPTSFFPNKITTIFKTIFSTTISSSGFRGFLPVGPSPGFPDNKAQISVACLPTVANVAVEEETIRRARDTHL